MSLSPGLEKRLRASHRWALERARAGSKRLLTVDDASAPRLGGVEEMAIDLPGRTLGGRLYRPADAETPGPLLLYFHGGGFVFGGLDTHDSICRRVCGASRVAVLSMDYRLAPESPYPAQVEDAFDCADWIMDHAADLDADPHRIAIGGDSAGGYMAISASLKNPGRFCAQLLFYPLMHVDDDAWGDSVFHDARVVGRVAVRYIREQLAAAQAGAPSLLGAASPSTPPTVVVTGGVLDPVRPDALKYAEELRALGVWCEVRQHGRQAHGFLNVPHVSRTARLALSEAGQLLARAMAQR